MYFRGQHLQSGAPVPVCLDIEEDDSPRKVALKKMIAYMDSQLRDEREKREKSAQEIRKLQGKLDQTTRELDAMKDIIKKVSFFQGLSGLWLVTTTACASWALASSAFVCLGTFVASFDS